MLPIKVVLTVVTIIGGATARVVGCGVGEFVADGKNGFLVSGNADQMAIKINSLSGDDQISFLFEPSI